MSGSFRNYIRNRRTPSQLPEVTHDKIIQNEHFEKLSKIIKRADNNANIIVNEQNQISTVISVTVKTAMNPKKMIWTVEIDVYRLSSQTVHRTKIHSEQNSDSKIQTHDVVWNVLQIGIGPEKNVLNSSDRGGSIWIFWKFHVLILKDINGPEYLVMRSR